MELSEDNIASICGYYPKPEDIGLVDNSVVAEIVKYVSQKYAGFSDSKTSDPPDFFTKIQFNKLGKNTAVHLNVGAYQVGYVDDYFRTNSDFSRQQCRDSLHGMYLHHAKANHSVIALKTGMTKSRGEVVSIFL